MHRQTTINTDYEIREKMIEANTNDIAEDADIYELRYEDMSNYIGKNKKDIHEETSEDKINHFFEQAKKWQDAKDSDRQIEVVDVTGEMKNKLLQKKLTKDSVKEVANNFCYKKSKTNNAEKWELEDLGGCAQSKKSRNRNTELVTNNKVLQTAKNEVDVKRKNLFATTSEMGTNPAGIEKNIIHEIPAWKVASLGKNLRSDVVTPGHLLSRETPQTETEKRISEVLAKNLSICEDARKFKNCWTIEPKKGTKKHQLSKMEKNTLGKQKNATEYSKIEYRQKNCSHRKQNRV